MSTLKVNKLRDTAGSTDAITLDPNGGAVLAGVTTISTARVTTGSTTTATITTGTITTGTITTGTITTAKVTTLQDASGNNSSTPEQIGKGRAKAWVAFDGTTNSGGNCTIDDSFNVSSVTDEGTGAYTVNFSTAMANANYCAHVSAGNNAANSLGAWNTIYDDATTVAGSCRIGIYSNTGSSQDNEQVFLVVFGG